MCNQDDSTCVDPRSLVVAGEIEIASLPCGAIAQAELELRNLGDEPIMFSATNTVSAVSVTPAMGSVPPVAVR